MRAFLYALALAAAGAAEFGAVPSSGPPDRVAVTAPANPGEP